MTGPLALTLGEPAGIGPDLTLTVWQRRVELDIPAFYALGDDQANTVGLYTSNRVGDEQRDRFVPVIDLDPHGCGVAVVVGTFSVLNRFGERPDDIRRLR